MAEEVVWTESRLGWRRKDMRNGRGPNLHSSVCEDHKVAWIITSPSGIFPRHLNFIFRLKIQTLSLPSTTTTFSIGT